MPRMFAQLVVAISLAVTWPLYGAPIGQDALTLKVTESPNSFRLTVPVSRLTMTIPRGSFVHETETGVDSGPRYFQFADSTSGLIISGWFESSDGFSNLQSFWDSEESSWAKHNLPAPKDTNFLTIGDWQCVSYSIDLPGVTNNHLRAELVRDGTWIDMHISITNRKSTAENRDLLASVLESIEVTTTAN